MPVVGYEGIYVVSEYGSVYRVRGYKRHPVTGLPLRAFRDASTGYLKVHLSAGGGTAAKTRSVHSLVCEAFHGIRPAGMEVRHIDGTRTNNEASNLEWGTHSENSLDKRRHGTSPRKDACKRGHVFERDGYYLMADGYRKCRPCALMHSAAQRERKKQMVRD